jgi:hypothetical protein
MENSLTKCPSLQKIEMLVIQNSPMTAEILDHFEHCPVCKNQYAEMVLYYRLLQEELAAPVSNSVLSFIQEIETECVLLSVIRLHPIESDSPGHPIFRCELIFQNLQDTVFTQFPEIKSDEILLRLLQDHANLKGCVAVLAKEPSFYKNVKLFFQKLNLVITTNAHGVGKIDPIQAETLTDQIVEIIP